MTPAVIQLRRTKRWHLQAESMALNGLPAVKVDRSTLWGNPWKAGNPGLLALRTMPEAYQVRLPIDQISAVEAFRFWLMEKPAWWMLPPPDMFTTRGWEGIWSNLNFQRHAIWTRLPSLRGKNLACWCAPGHPCHAHELLRLANPDCRTSQGETGND